MASNRILCFDLNNGHMTFKLRKVNFPGHGPADHDLNLRVIQNWAIMWAKEEEQKVLFQINFKFILSRLTIVQPVPASPCIAMAESGLATAQIAKKGYQYWDLKVWSTVKIRGTRVPQKAIVPVGRLRPYSIIILNMRFIPKASLRASSQFTASSNIYLSDIYEDNGWAPVPT